MRRRGARLIGLLALAAALGPAEAWALRPTPVALPPTSTSTQPASLWQPEWPRFMPEEYGVTAGLFLGLTAVTVLIPTPPAGWKTRGGIDGTLRDVLRLEDRDARQAVSLTSDILQDLTLTLPVLVDIGVGALLLHKDPDLAVEMVLIDAEAVALATSMVVLTKRSVGRVRPEIEPCADGGYACRTKVSRRSFLSGHATAAFTAAGLSCVHHQHLKLFGGVGDDLMCAGMLSLATTSALFRVVSDKHWTTDVVMGGITGLISGYALPYLLHYQGPWRFPGARDGRLDGSLTLYGLTGVTRLDDRAGITGGVSLEGRALFGGEAVQVEGNVQGRLLYDSEGLALRDISPGARLWIGPVGLGGTLVYRSHQRDEAARVSVTWGPTVSLGTFDEDHPVTVSVSWLPGGDGDVDQWAARLSGGLARHVALSLEVSPLVAPSEGGAARGSAVTLGVGGRLPW